MLDTIDKVTGGCGNGFIRSKYKKCLAHVYAAMCLVLVPQDPLMGISGNAHFNSSIQRSKKGFDWKPGLYPPYETDCPILEVCWKLWKFLLGTAVC